MTSIIVSVIDFFYPPFKRIMPLQTFRYAACGGFNVMMGFVLFTFLYHFFAAKNEVIILYRPFEPHSVALFISSCIVFCIGFLLNKYVVFTTSNLKGRIQLFRYFLSFVSNLAINYLLLTFLVKFAGLHPVWAQSIVTAIVIAISYFTQQYFTFKVKETV